MQGVLEKKDELQNITINIPEVYDKLIYFFFPNRCLAAREAIWDLLQECGIFIKKYEVIIFENSDSKHS